MSTKHYQAKEDLQPIRTAFAVLLRCTRIPMCLHLKVHITCDAQGFYYHKNLKKKNF